MIVPITCHLRSSTCSAITWTRGYPRSFSLGLECPAPLPGWVPYALRGWPTRHRMQSAARILLSHLRPIQGSQEVLPKSGEHRRGLNYYRETLSRTGRSSSALKPTPQTLARLPPPDPRPHTSPAAIRHLLRGTPEGGRPRISACPAQNKGTKPWGTGGPRHRRGEARPLP